MRLGLRILALGCGCLSALMAGAVWFIDHVGTSEAANHVLGHRGARAVVVLGARVEPDGRASETLSARVQHGVEVFRRTGANVLVLSGGVGTYGESEASVARDLAVALGVPREACLVEEQSHSTAQNARFSVELLRQRFPDGRRIGVIVVSDPYHLLRASLLFERENVDVDTSPVLDAPRHRSWPLRLAWTAREVPALLKDLWRVGG
ncbi:MAG: YdcF family protein [Myxococcota bacterium]